MHRPTVCSRHLRGYSNLSIELPKDGRGRGGIRELESNFKQLQKEFHGMELPRNYTLVQRQEQKPTSSIVS